MPGQCVQCRDRVFSKFSSERKEGLENLLGWTILKGGTFFSQHWDDLFICWQRGSRKGNFW